MSDNFNQHKQFEVSPEFNQLSPHRTPHFQDPYSLSSPKNQNNARYQEEQKGSFGMVSVKDFKILENIGSGTFGIVYLVEKDGKQYAMKELMKDQILKVGKIESVFREQDYLKKFNHPAIPKLYYTFQDQSSLYFVMEHVPNGTLHQVLDQLESKEQKGLPQALARFYAAQLVIGIEYIHSFQIAHRDLKPLNILLDDQFYLKIIDFGDSKEITEQDLLEDMRISASRSSESFSNIFLKQDDRKQHNKVREGTFVGTPLYVAPEMLEYNQSGQFSDLWALGCIIYQLLTGSTPFQGKTHDEVFQNILERRIKFPMTMESDAKDLINKLLDFNPENRLGYKNFYALKSHPFFRDIDFKRLQNRELNVPNLEVFGVSQSYSLITDDSDDSAKKRFLKSILSKMEKDDECCVQVDYNKKVYEGTVKVKRKIFFYKKRYMVLQEDGLVVFAKPNGQVRCDLIIDERAEVIKLKAKRFQIKTPKVVETIETPDTDTWVQTLLKLKQQRTQKRQQGL